MQTGYTHTYILKPTWSRVMHRMHTLGNVVQHFPEHVYERVVPRTIRISESPSFGKTIFEHEPSGVGARAYYAIAHEFLERHGDVADN